MNWDGGEAFTRFLRLLVVDACASACADGGSMLTVGGPSSMGAHRQAIRRPDPDPAVAPRRTASRSGLPAPFSGFAEAE